MKSIDAGNLIVVLFLSAALFAAGVIFCLLTKINIFLWIALYAIFPFLASLIFFLFNRKYKWVCRKTHQLDYKREYYYYVNGYWSGFLSVEDGRGLFWITFIAWPISVIIWTILLVYNIFLKIPND